MAVELTAFAILDNHLHAVLRNRPDLVESWSDEEVARRWLRLCPGRREQDDSPLPEPTPEQIEALAGDRDKLTAARAQLSSISWYHKFLKEYIARRANEEDDCSGAFWEGRFKSTRLLDFYALLLCCMYVDLNWIRAGMAETPEDRQYTSAHVRILARQSGDLQVAAWLAPVDESCLPVDAGLGLRASEDGFLSMTPDEYLQCLDCFGRHSRPGKRGQIPDRVPPILERLQLDPERCFVGVNHFDSMFGSAAGTRASLQSHARSHDRVWYHGMDALTSQSATNPAV